MSKKVIIEEMKIGDIVIAKIQIKNDAQKSARPVLVIKKGKEDENDRCLVVLPLTTCLKRAFMPGSVFLPAEGTGLPFDSLVYCDSPVAVSMEDTGRRVSSLTDVYFSAVCKEALKDVPFDRFFG